MSMLGTVTAADRYSLETQNEIDTPERTVSYEGQELTLDDIGVVNHGETLSVDAAGPSHPLTVQLRSATDPSALLASDSLSTDGTTSFEMDYSPGTYMVLLSYGEYRRGVPVVVSGYDIDAEVIKHANTDEATISADVTRTESSESPSSVDAMLWNENTNQSVTLTQQSTGTYEKQVSTAAFDEDYEVYVVARGDKQLHSSSENDILGIDEADFKTSDSGSDNNAGGSTGDGDSQSDSDTSLPTNDTTNTTNGTNETGLPDNGTLPDENQTIDNGTSPNETSPVDDGNKDSDDNNEHSDEVIEPNDPTQNSSNTNETNEVNDQTPLSTSLAVIALLSVAFVMSRQH